MPEDMEQCNSFIPRKARKCHHPYDSPRNQNPEENTSKDGEMDANKKELDDARCPICMEHPHNAVLILCSSHDQGCRSYMCDTSYRHSNCLDQYRKPRENCRNNASQSVETLGLRSLQNFYEDTRLGGPGRRPLIARSWRSQSGEIQETQNRRVTHSLYALHSNRRQDGLSRDNAAVEGETESQESSPGHGNEIDVAANGGVELKCPLCRGAVHGWKVIEDARHYLNLKVRSCARESCSFSGTYEELRKHARSVHPTTRPTDVDPSRQNAWRQLERQRDYGDVLSTIRSAMPSAVVIGDYVIDSEDGMHLDRDSERDALGTPGPWWTTFFLFHMIGPMSSLEDARGLPARWRGSRRQHLSSGMHTNHPNLWGEDITGSQEADDVSGNGATGRRRRRRLNRPRPDGDMP